ncbi:MAG: hypothetical protein V4597_08500 [Pseudomonadota bacterium]
MDGIDKQRLRKKRDNEAAKARAIRILGGRCSNVSCRWVNDDGTTGCADTRALQIDHVNGGGLNDLKAGQGPTYYRHVTEQHVAGTGKYQLLCANCNWIKRFTRNEVRNGRATTDLSVETQAQGCLSL